MDRPFVFSLRYAYLISHIYAVQVFDNKGNRTMLYIVGGCVGLFVCLYFLVKK